jgi:hypothetical protein
VTASGLDERGVGVAVLGRIVQTGSGVHPTYPMGNGGSFSGGKAAEA